MFGGGSANPQFLAPLDNGRLPYNCNAVPPMQFDVHIGSNGGTMNMIGNNNSSLVNLPTKFSTVDPFFSQNKLPITLNDGIGPDEGEQARSIWKQIPVSTGLKLSYGDEDHISSISLASETEMVKLSSVLSHHDNLQSDELDQYIRIQEENLRKGMAELTHRHTMSLLNALEKEVNSRMFEKDAEIEGLNHKNRELMDQVRQLASEAQSWHYKAKQNESLVNALRTNINQVYLQQAAIVKEGYDENMLDDAASSCNVGVLPSASTREQVICKVCKSKEVCVVLLPCRHLCLCNDCEVPIEICPICGGKKTGGLQVYMS